MPVDTATLNAGDSLLEVTGIAMLNLRGNGKGRRLRHATRQSLGLVPPLAPNTVVHGWEASALWLGPDEWLIRCSITRVDGLYDALRSALSECHHALTDVTHARRVIRLAGPHAREVLAKGCSLDLHPRVFAIDETAQTLLAKIDIILHRIKPTDGIDPAFELYVSRSLFEYAWDWLADAAGKFVNPVTQHQCGIFSQSRLTSAG